MFHAYVIACAEKGHYYVGETEDLPRRLKVHQGLHPTYTPSSFIKRYGFGELLEAYPVPTRKLSLIMERFLAKRMAQQGYKVASNSVTCSKLGEVNILPSKWDAFEGHARPLSPYSLAFGPEWTDPE